ncbi:MAG: type II toxin-antitoxin system RelE/ParE family toxin [Burkholderiales bacterium]|nr:type II toxin-antitoxin system RelE/ParE family toxin [Burkholderiales bacterium]
MIVSFNELARTEITSAIRWLAEKAGPSAAADFAAEVWRSFDRIVERPLIGTPGVRNTRRVIVRRFPYSIVYRLDGEAIRILAIAHQRRRPRYWVGRG